MLSDLQPDLPQRRTHSLRHQYEEFVLQRIEEYKEQLSRAQLMSLGDDAIRELEVGPEGQLVLTEVLMLDHVDRIIKRRLRLPNFRRWRERHLRMRQAQRDPVHWGLPGDTPLTKLVSRFQDGDLALVLGARAAPAALLLAAHDVNVLLIDQDLSGVESVESHAASEALGERLQALVINLGGWFPDVIPAMVVLDPNLLADLDDTTRARLIKLIQDQTVPNGSHIVLALPRGDTSDPAPPDAWQRYYAGWISDNTGRASRSKWFLARRP